MVGCAGNAPAGRKARRIYSPSRLFSGLTALDILILIVFVIFNLVSFERDYDQDYD